MSDLASGGSASLAGGNLARTIDILDRARDQVLFARARAGAFEKFTIDSARTFLDDAAVEIASAISRIGDVDVALASANLVRGQILTASTGSDYSTQGKTPPSNTCRRDTCPHREDEMLWRSH